MTTQDKVTAYFETEHRFKTPIQKLRNLAQQTSAQETFKWSFPVYTVEHKNVFGICRFKNHYGIWFFNGAYLSDPLGVLENAQEGKTIAMRHWKFSATAELPEKDILSYLNQAILFEIDKRSKPLKN